MVVPNTIATIGSEYATSLRIMIVLLLSRLNSWLLSLYLRFKEPATAALVPPLLVCSYGDQLHLRRDLKYDAIATGPTFIGRAVQVAALVKNNPGRRKQPIASIRVEALQSLFGPLAAGSWRQFEDRAVGVCTPHIGRAVQISLGIESKPGVENGPSRVIEAE